MWNRFDKKILKKYKSIHDLERDLSKRKFETVKNREKIRICVLDDDGFDAQQLRKVGYKNISIREKFDEINDFENYNVVLCDVDGIGYNFDNVKQGLAVAEQIVKSFYPRIQVAIYTGKELTNYEYEEIEGVKVIRKNIPTSQLTQELDELCSVFWNPVKTWSLLEKYYRSQDLPNKEITILEDIFVSMYDNSSEDYILRREKLLNLSSYKGAISTGLIFAKLAIEIIHES